MGPSLSAETFDERCETLLERCQSGQWDADHDLPWQTPRALEQVTLAGPLLTPALRAQWPELEPAQRAAKVRFCLSTLLTNLARGENFVDEAAAELAERLEPASVRPLVAMQSIDEARHAVVLERYVRDYLGYAPPPERFVVADRLPADTVLAKETWQTTALLVLILEVAALAAIQGLRTYCDEPLASKILRRIVADESRHISVLVLALRGPDAQLETLPRAHLNQVIRLGWVQGLKVTEAPVLQVARALSDDPDAPPDPEWTFFRQMIASTLIPKLELIGVMNDALRQAMV